MHVVRILSNGSARSDSTEGIKRQPGSMFPVPLHGCWGVEGRSTPCALRKYRWCVLLLSWQRAGKGRWSHLTGPGRAFSNKMHPGNGSGAHGWWNCYKFSAIHNEGEKRILLSSLGIAEEPSEPRAAEYEVQERWRYSSWCIFLVCFASASHVGCVLGELFLLDEIHPE